jgi:DMSO/TMAO reductase YedYZ molybdopterin-dependent catalytic subunit
LPPCAAAGCWQTPHPAGPGPPPSRPRGGAAAAGIGTLWLLCHGAQATGEVAVEHDPTREIAVVAGPITAPTGSVTGQGANAMAAHTPGHEPGPVRSIGQMGRRRFLALSGAVVMVSVAAAAAGRGLRSRFSAASSRADVVLPAASEPLAVAPVSVGFDTGGISPFYTPNADFYRVDTALAVPQVPAESWTLKVTGLVDREIEISYDELLRRNLVEEDITLTCVSNTVGGSLTGTARWLGLPLRELLDEAGVDASADQIIGRSVDGYTCGFPLEAAYDRPALIAIGMNGEPLPIVNGFPARLMVPGLYGYVSATKWLTEIELSRFDAFDQYWVERGWDQQAPIKLMSRIDTPRTLGKVPAGPFVIGGVAWAQTIGIAKVEVAIDGDDFREAELADELNVNTWRQWKIDWDATPGRHRITVRATDANGELQTDTRADPFPNGASGWMSIFVDVQDA